MFICCWICSAWSNIHAYINIHCVCLISVIDGAYVATWCLVSEGARNFKQKRFDSRVTAARYLPIAIRRINKYSFDVILYSSIKNIRMFSPVGCSRILGRWESHKSFPCRRWDSVKRMPQPHKWRPPNLNHSSVMCTWLAGISLIWSQYLHAHTQYIRCDVMWCDAI